MQLIIDKPVAKGKAVVATEIIDETPEILAIGAVVRKALRVLDEKFKTNVLGNFPHIGVKLVDTHGRSNGLVTKKNLEESGNLRAHYVANDGSFRAPIIQVANSIMGQARDRVLAVVLAETLTWRGEQTYTPVASGRPYFTEMLNTQGKVIGLSVTKDDSGKQTIAISDVAVNLFGSLVDGHFIKTIERPEREETEAPHNLVRKFEKAREAVAKAKIQLLACECEVCSAYVKANKVKADPILTV